MPPEITVGPPQLVIHDGETVWASDQDGQLVDESGKGLLFRDTRLLDTWRIFADGTSWDLLNSGALTHFAARAFLTNQAFVSRDGPIPARSLNLALSRWIAGGVHEDIDITNHSRAHVRFNLEVMIRTDFSDIFEVKSGRIVRRGQVTTAWSSAEQCLTSTYVNADFSRALALRAQGESPAVYSNGRLSFVVSLPPRATWHACLHYDLHDGAVVIAAPTACTCDVAHSEPALRLATWRQSVLKLQTSNENIYRLYRQAVEDMAALRLPYDGELIPGAGLPWFLVLFGRDSLITSMQCAPVTTAFARGTLAVLGARQADAMVPERDAEPGKILHELRRGELAHFNLIPHTPYFGTADATPLYVMLLHTAWRWTGDIGLLERYLANAERCLDWADRYGDRDGDGFQEYETRAPTGGYENLGWKDSGDGVLHEDGSMVVGPKALCELQGYVYAAKRAMAEIYEALNKPDRAAVMRTEAEALYIRFNEQFWDEKLGFYLFALDGEKRPVRSVVSNVGHCLWSGIIDPARAAQVVARLMAPDMFSGWGIRTMSSDHPAYDPYSYHRGSVWPHDNGLIALGFKRYGFAKEAGQVMRGISGAAAFFFQHQMPELFGGLDRAATDFPVQYLSANVPQAWAAGAAFSFLQAVLGLEPDAPNRRLIVDPVLPAWLPDIRLSDLKLGDQSFDIVFRRQGEHTEFEVLKGDPAAIVRKLNA